MGVGEKRNIFSSESIQRPRSTASASLLAVGPVQRARSSLLLKSSGAAGGIGWNTEAGVIDRGLSFCCFCALCKETAEDTLSILDNFLYVL